MTFVVQKSLPLEGIDVVQVQANLEVAALFDLPGLGGTGGTTGGLALEAFPATLDCSLVLSGSLSLCLLDARGFDQKESMPATVQLQNGKRFRLHEIEESFVASTQTQTKQRTQATTVHGPFFCFTPCCWTHCP